jgi:polysaccharide biosynthesis protein PslG
MNVAIRSFAVPCLVLAALFGLAAPASARKVPRGFYGAVYDGAVTQAPADVQDAQFARMARAGVESVRTVFSWADAQPAEHGPIDFSATDQAVALAAAHRLSLLPVVIYTPAWARADSSTAASPPKHPRDYVAYLRALAERYGSRGSFWSEHPELPRRPVRYWQIWNEPHLRLYWNASHWQRGYGRLLRASHAALRHTDRRAHVVLAGLTGFAWTALRSLYKHGHVKGAFDVAGLQTYTGSAHNLLRAVRLFRRVLKRYGAAHMPLWLTEMGWPAAKGRARVPSYQRTIATTNRGMAKRLKHGYALLAAARHVRALRVSRAYWYSWASPYVRSSNPGTGIFRFAGLLRFRKGVFTPQLAYRAYIHSARAHEGCAKTATARCR